jgi:WD40-like Beta Propeller Repeat
MPDVIARCTILLMSSPSRRLLAVCGALVALAVAAPAASADSIAYIKGGDVWLSTGDGARQYRVTSTGQYADVSQADDGTMIALTGVRLHRLDRQGNVLADFDTPVSDTRAAPAKTFYGPFDPAISPDGTKVAYTYHYMTQSQSPTCYPPTCFVGINEGGTGYSWADRQTGWDDPALGKHSGWRNPVWLDEDTVMLSDPTHMPNHDVILDTLSDGDFGNLVHGWFSDIVDGNPHMSGGDITRDRTKLAFATGQNESTLTVSAVTQFPTTFRDGEAPASTRPTICYRYSGPVGKYSTPTFSPDGGRLAWAEDDGIRIVTVPSFAAGCTLDGATPQAPLVIPGGSQPDWGPADVPADRGPDGGGGGGGGLKAKAVKTKLGRALAKGFGVKVTAPSAGRVRATATDRGLKVASGAKRVAGGKATVKLRFSRGARNALDNARRVKLRVKVAFTAAGGGTKSATIAVTLKR